MTGYLCLATVAAALLAPATALAEETPSPASLLPGLKGEWVGALGYRDYQSNQLFELPVRTSIENVPDGVTQVRRSFYDEGRNQAPVWIVSLLQASKDGIVSTAIMRAGREPELLRESVRVASYTAPNRWIAIATRTGTDDDKPADIRVTETRHGEELLSVKEVRPAGDASAPWLFRNQTRLKRVAGK